MEEKWAHKHVSRRAVREAMRVTSYAAFRLPKAEDPTAWIDTEYTLTLLRCQLRKIRANLAQGYEGPHLYPLSRTGDDVVAAFLDALTSAVRAGDRHSSFDTWRLLFILKKGRDRYDLKGGCRPIVCLSSIFFRTPAASWIYGLLLTLWQEE